MSNRGRPKSTDPRAKFLITLRPELMERLDVICYDPFFQKPQKGARTQHIEKALEQYLNRLEGKASKSAEIAKLGKEND